MQNAIKDLLNKKKKMKILPKKENDGDEEPHILSDFNLVLACITLRTMKHFKKHLIS
jgi:hypothetical protein